jgi:hypothetical protein
MNKEQYGKSQYKGNISEVVLTCESLRKDSDSPMDISLQEFVTKKWGISLDTLYEDLGINPSSDTIQNIVTLPDTGVRYLIPEIIRDALRLGLRKSPIWQDIVAAEQTIKNPSVTIPHINMSEATPRYVGEAETIPTGTISFGSKTLKVRKIGKGIKIPYEVSQYVAINVVGIFLQDFGVKLNQAIDSLMIDTLINGEQTNGSESAPVVGIDTIGSVTYRDLLRIWIRMARLGKTAKIIIGGENAALDTLDLDEFKKKNSGTTDAKLNLKTPVPDTTNYYIHGSMPSNQQMIIDPSSAIIKYNAQPLLVETDKIISNQTIETYASLTTGFGKLFRDAALLMDSSLDFQSGNGFPSYMEVDTLEDVTIE